MVQPLEQNQLRAALLCGALLLSAAALVANTGEAIAGAKEGLTLCTGVIIPSLFPFFVLSSLVVDLGLAAYLGRALEGVMRPLFRVSGSCAAALVMGLIGGYPVGARTALQLYEQGQCTKKEAERLLAFCNNSGPAFILGVVGAGVFGSGRVGALVYLTHATSALLVGILFRFSGGREEKGASAVPRSAIQTVRVSTAFTGAVVKALQSSLNICAFVIFFSVVLRLLSAYGALAAFSRLLALFGVGEEWTTPLAAGLLELSSGVSSLAGTGQAGVPMAAFMLGWAGLSVHCQVLSVLGDSGLSVRGYIMGKLCHGLIAAGLTWAVIRLFPLSAPVSAALAEQAGSAAALDLSAALPISLAAGFVLWAAAVLLWVRLLKKSCGKSPRHRI